MLIFGSRGKAQGLGQMATQHCQTCERERSFSLGITYRYFHLYFLFGAVTDKRYSIACDVCHRGWELESKEVESQLKTNPIPFMFRYGIAMLIGAVAVAATAGAAASRLGVG
ncbi:MULTISPECIES: hypothetical protein [unclassified Caballeronia]|uniref:hypothetical protein n=1 Tax=unclassified Caballeronia TaxID=2646786 RepID=UPI00025B9A0C|nr:MULTISPECIES: hypothetical protein [unclassified Caballeronia]EKS70347.1 hypothetical protein BURK_019775 [Burkholderia sp. SJ98]MCE4546380.1 hypothetical protein [Caballeronia sp. PC1]MCE4573145.1 hypothetical protein [Caballeronia sp. CLC5]